MFLADSWSRCIGASQNLIDLPRALRVRIFRDISCACMFLTSRVGGRQVVGSPLSPFVVMLMDAEREVGSLPCLPPCYEKPTYVVWKVPY